MDCILWFPTPRLQVKVFGTKEKMTIAGNHFFFKNTNDWLKQNVRIWLWPVRDQKKCSDRWTNKHDTHSFGMSVVTKLFVDKMSRKRHHVNGVCKRHGIVPNLQEALLFKQ